MRTHVSLIGSLYLLQGFLALLAALFAVAVGFELTPASLRLPEEGADALRPVVLGAGAFCGALAVFYVLLARAMFRLRPWARVVTIVIGIFNLLGAGFPIGIYMLWVCFSAKGAALFDEQVRLYADDQPSYVSRRRSLDDAPHVPEARGDAYPSSGCMFMLFGVGALIVIGLPVVWFVYGSQIRRALDQAPAVDVEELVPDLPTPDPTPVEGEEPAAQPADGEGPPPPPPAEQVEDLPGYWAYTDEDGTRHIVNGFDKIPERFRPR